MATSEERARLSAILRDDDVVHADGVADALMALTRGPAFSAAILDLAHPAADPAGLLELRRHAPDLAIVALTGSLEAPAAREALVAGAGVIEKGALDAGLLDQSLRHAIVIASLRARLRATEARLDEVQRLQTELLNNVAHDMATPLMVLQLRMDALAEEPVAEDGSLPVSARSYQSMRNATQRLSRLTRDIRDVTLIDARAFRLHLRRLDLVPLLMRAVAASASDAQATGVRVDVSLEDAVVEGDEARIEQAVAQLLSNALRFSPERGRIGVGLSSAGDTLRIEVSDEGPGVPETARERLFKPFSRVHDAGKERVGAGLGLYIARGIARAHGGDLVLLPRVEGEGARFRLELPRARG